MTAAPLARTPQPRSVGDTGAAGATPAVSVIIATYNSGSLLTAALDALGAQTLPGHLIEILIVDDGSTDETWVISASWRLSEATSRSFNSRTPVVLALDATAR